MSTTTPTSLGPELQHSTFAFPNHTQQTHESPKIQHLITTLGLQEHVEGGYYVETDRDRLRVPNPFTPVEAGDETRSASTTIFYLITPARPVGRFHRNKARTVHTLHSGRGRYVLLHADELEGSEKGDGEEKGKGKVRIETFVVGRDLAKGERLQWIVEGGKYKASFLLPLGEGEAGSTDCADCGGCLISETVVPGFEFKDHDFLEMKELRELVTPDQAKELEWLVRKE